MFTTFFIIAFVVSFLWGVALYRNLVKTKRKSLQEGSVLRQERRDVGRDFVANASHELRTPITIIKGYLETLRDMPEVSQELFNEILDKMVNSCQRMESLVRSLLLLADLENSPKGGFIECDLIEVIDSLSYNLISLHQEATIESYFKDEPIHIWANVDLIELALRNLLENAVKYARGAARISIRLQKLESVVEIRIRDEGMGIPEKDLPHLFDRFYTVDKTHSRRLGGAGLGLSIVKKIVENHQGEIKVLSKHQEWTEFQLRFFLAEKVPLSDMYKGFVAPQVANAAP